MKRKLMLFIALAKIAQTPTESTKKGIEDKHFLILKI